MTRLGMGLPIESMGLPIEGMDLPVESMGLPIESMGLSRAWACLVEGMGLSSLAEH